MTPGFTTYAMPNSGPGYSSATHYFENNFEIAGTLILDSLSAGVAQINGSNQLITSNTIASPTFTGTATVATENVQFLTVEPPTDGVCFSITSPNFGNFIIVNTYTGPSFNVNQSLVEITRQKQGKCLEQGSLLFALFVALFKAKSNTGMIVSCFCLKVGICLVFALMEALP